MPPPKSFANDAAQRPMRILLTNDDGYGAQGLEALISALAALEDVDFELTVVAPVTEQSAKSHAITLSHPLRLRQMAPAAPAGSAARVRVRRFALDGTPSDCVYMGVRYVLRETEPCLICSGINRGPNVGSDVVYSGTVAAAVEGALMGIPAIAFSLAKGDDFAAASRLAASLVRRVLSSPSVTDIIPAGVALNVNFPEHPGRFDGAWDGRSDAHCPFAVTRLGSRSYGGEVIERTDPRGKPYLWVGGSEAIYDLTPGTDCEAVFGRGVPSLTPIAADLTAAQAIDGIRKRLGIPSPRLDGAGGTPV